MLGGGFSLQPSEFVKVSIILGMAMLLSAQVGAGRRGIVAWFSLQSFENIGMALGIMPVAGIPPPFVSYGGSSMFAVWVVVGLLQSIRVQRPVQA